MLSPRTYYGYNNESKCIASATALDATTLLDPAEVKAAVDNLENVFSTEMSSIATALRNMTTDANEAVIVQGTSMSGTIEDTATAISQIPGQVSSSFSELYSYSCQVHDSLQEQANEEARAAVAGKSGVVRVTG